MNSNILKTLLEFDGDYKFFEQRDYIKLNHWADADPTKRRGAWVGDKYGKDGELIHRGFSGGVCLGLSLSYIISGKSWSDFTSFIANERGKSVIRGIMNFQEVNLQLPLTKRLKSSVIRRDVLSANRVTLLRSRVMPASIMYEHGGGNIINNVDSSISYNIGMLGPFDGHSVSMRFNEGRIRLFDPNYGEFSFPYVNKQSKGMSLLIGYILSCYYPGRYTELHIDEYILTNN